MLAITLVIIVVGLLIVAVLASWRAGRTGSRRNGYAPGEGGAVGYVPGYMPGIRQKTEQHEDTATELVDPPHERDAAVDLDSNTVHLRRSDSGTR